MRNYFTILFSLLPLLSFSQRININLSTEHKQKLSSIESGHKRMVKFYKYYKKDSSQHIKKLDKKYKKATDSTWRAERKLDKLERRLVKRGIVIPKPTDVGDSVNRELKKWYAVLKDSTTSDSLKLVAKSKVKELAMHRARQYPGYQHLEERYKIYGDSINWEELAKQVPGMDTLGGILQVTPSELFAESEKLAEKNILKMGGVSSLGGDLSKVDELKGLTDQYKNQYSSVLNKDSLANQGKELATDKAMDYFSKHPEQLQSAQQKVSKLLSKYKSFSNSTDLKDAKKHTSMEGKTLWERLVLGGTFNVISTKPVAIDLSPQLGFKFSTKFFMGVGMNYRHTFGDSIKNNWYVSPVNTGFKVYANYDIIKNFYAYAEWERAGVNQNVDDNTQKQWINNYFIGVGRKFLIHPKLYMTITALYNLNGLDENPVYLRRFQMKIGFQLSELATRKKQVYYDPNR